MKPEKAEDQNPPTTKAAAKRKPKKKKKLCAPESADEKLPKTGGKNAGRQYTEEELDYVLSKTQLARLLERDPILSFVRPKLINELTGPIQEPDWESITDVRMAVHALFGMLRESGFVLGAFEMERVFDWELASWKDSIKTMMGPLAGLVGMVKREAKPPRGDPGVVPPPLPRPQYQSSVGSDSSIESPKRMPMPGRSPRIMQLIAAPTRTETPPPKENVIPKALEEAIIRLMRSTMMRTMSVPTRTEPAPTVRTTPQATTPREPADVAMESVSSRSTPRSKRQARDQDEDPEDLFDLETGTPGTTATVSTATAGTSLTRRAGQQVAYAPSSFASQTRLAQQAPPNSCSFVTITERPRELLLEPNHPGAETMNARGTRRLLPRGLIARLTKTVAEAVCPRRCAKLLRLGASQVSLGGDARCFGGG
ncbi:Eukaryotic/viral aspartic protease [Phytophthora cinnamomi]|uniref:Eukaryotic/viral aspartic protease n=1 Tax=Phytophthora cinnamomi TaxID=4785 RepID=UPI00355A5684|nr:Eukaryotic/viral aspartic protease [Phytophthora cinnamomi]